jgi:hypothetical protein
MMSLTIDHHMVPFACFFGHVHLGSDSSYDSAVVMSSHFIIRLSGGIENLALNSCFHRVFRIPNPEKYSAVSLVWIFVFQFQYEITEFLFGD